MFGWIFFAHQLGAAVAAYGASILHRWGGDYAFTFSMAGAFAILGTGLVLCIQRESYIPVKIRMKILDTLSMPMVDGMTETAASIGGRVLFGYPSIANLF